MRTWIIYSAVFLALALVFFHRGFHTRNKLFAAWLVYGAGQQLFFAFARAAGWRPLRVEAALMATGWALTAATLIVARRGSSDWVNQVIFAGLVASVALHLAQLPAWFSALPRAARFWASNVAGVVPTVYMLVRFSGVRPDRLAVWSGRFFATLRMTTQEGATWARSIFS